MLFIYYLLVAHLQEEDMDPTAGKVESVRVLKLANFIDKTISFYVNAP